MTLKPYILALPFVCLVPSPSSAADLTNGKREFGACAACHTAHAGSLGPNLAGVLGRAAASRQDFRYSAALKRSQLKWTPAELRRFLKDPQGTVRGNKMPFGGISSEKTIDDLIAYMATIR